MQNNTLKLKTALLILALLLSVSVHSQTEEATSLVIHTDESLSAVVMQACNLANVQENRFQYVGLFSPVVHRKQLPTNQGTSYWIGSGKVDIFHSQSCRFVKKTKNKRISCVFYNTSGGHTWRNWRLYLSEYLQFIFKSTDK